MTFAAIAVALLSGCTASSVTSIESNPLILDSSACRPSGGGDVQAYEFIYRLTRDNKVVQTQTVFSRIDQETVSKSTINRAYVSESIFVENEDGIVSEKLTFETAESGVTLHLDSGNQDGINMSLNVSELVEMKRLELDNGAYIESPHMRENSLMQTISWKESVVHKFGKVEDEPIFTFFTEPDENDFAYKFEAIACPLSPDGDVEIKFKSK